MFSPEQRARLRSELLEYAAQDARITAAAITGSAAENREDRWSDIDLAFGVEDAAVLPTVLSDWTAHMYDWHQALHHLDVRSGAWIYRVFLLPGTLQVDLAFVSAGEFRALAHTFRLMFGNANEPLYSSPPLPDGIIGLAWLYALHARNCIARGRVWQAEYMISGIRDNALALACIRHGLPVVHGRGFDELPKELTARFEDALVRHVGAAEVSRAFQVVIGEFRREMRSTNGKLAERLEETLQLLSETGHIRAGSVHTAL